VTKERANELRAPPAKPHGAPVNLETKEAKAALETAAYALDSMIRHMVRSNGTNEERMLTYLYASVFDSPAQTLVNTVNTVGIMGKGIAKTFRERYPAMFREYRRLCEREELKVGRLHLWKGDRWVLNFPTKTTWRLPSKIEYIEAGLQTFVASYERMGLVSVSFPPLGCGNGNLDWTEVRPLMERYLNKINIPVYVHSVHVGDEFVPEHVEERLAPTTFDEFWLQVRAAILENKGEFFTGEGGQSFSVKILNENELGIVRGGRQREKIPFDEITNSWMILRDSILSVDKFSDEASRRYKSYLFPILKSLPYVRSAPASHQDGPIKAEALFFARHSGRSEDARIEEQKQGCLSL
jgi:O-acetyl-ADP-ribose deacetylase (regulator of RNase III)